MKNFSNLLGTDPKLSVNIVLQSMGTPLRAIIKINDLTVRDSRVTGDIVHRFNLPLTSPFSISIIVSGKDYNADSTSAIIIKHLDIDGFDICSGWTHLAHYQNDHNYTDPTTHLGFNGEWRLEVTEPFYTWRHQTLSLGWLLDPESVAK